MHVTFVKIQEFIYGDDFVYIILGFIAVLFVGLIISKFRVARKDIRDTGEYAIAFTFRERIKDLMQALGWVVPVVVSGYAIFEGRKDFFEEISASFLFAFWWHGRWYEIEKNKSWVEAFLRDTCLLYVFLAPFTGFVLGENQGLAILEYDTFVRSALVGSLVMLVYNGLVELLAEIVVSAIIRARKLKAESVKAGLKAAGARVTGTFAKVLPGGDGEKKPREKKQREKKVREAGKGRLASLLARFSRADQTAEDRDKARRRQTRRSKDGDAGPTRFTPAFFYEKASKGDEAAFQRLVGMIQGAVEVFQTSFSGAGVPEDVVNAICSNDRDAAERALRNMLKHAKTDHRKIIHALEAAS